MAPSHFVDIHPHIISADESRYPRSPLFGVQSEWSRERPITIDQYVAAMDAAGVQQAAIVQASTCYGYDNSYLTDAIAKYPGRLTAVGSVNLVEPDAPATIQRWMARGLTGLRLFTGGSTKSFDTSALDDPRSFAAWELCAEAGIPICLQTDPTGLAQVAGLASDALRHLRCGLEGGQGCCPQREEKLGKAEKYANQVIEMMKTAPKPNPQITDEQWTEAKKDTAAEAYNAIGVANLTRKKYDAAAAAFKSAVDANSRPEPAYMVRLASALQSGGKNDEAIALCDKVTAIPDAHPQIKQVAGQIRAAAVKAGGKAPGGEAK